MKKIIFVQDEFISTLEGEFRGKVENAKVLAFWRSNWLGSVSFSEQYAELFSCIEKKMTKITKMGGWNDSGWMEFKEKLEGGV